MRITPCHQWEPRSLGLSLGVGWEWGILASLRVLKWCSMAFPTNAILGCFSDQSRLHNHQACFNARCGEVGGQEQQAFDAAEVNPEEALRVRKDVKNLGARSCSQMMNASTLMHVATCELISPFWIIQFGRPIMRICEYNANIYLIFIPATELPLWWGWSSYQRCWATVRTFALELTQ